MNNDTNAQIDTVAELSAQLEIGMNENAAPVEVELAPEIVMAGPVVRAPRTPLLDLFFSTKTNMAVKYGRRSSSTPFAIFADGAKTPLAIDKLGGFFGSAQTVKTGYVVNPGKNPDKSIEWLVREASRANNGYEARFGYGLRVEWTFADRTVAMPIAKLFQAWLANATHTALAARSDNHNPNSIALASVSDRVPVLSQVLPAFATMLTRKALRKLAGLDANTNFAVVFHIGVNRVLKAESRFVNVKDTEGEVTGRQVASSAQVQAYSGPLVAGGTFVNENEERKSIAGICVGIVAEGETVPVWVAFHSITDMVAGLSGLELNLAEVLPRRQQIKLSEKSLNAYAYGGLLED